MQQQMCPMHFVDSVVNEARIKMQEMVANAGAMAIKGAKEDRVVVERERWLQ